MKLSDWLHPKPRNPRIVAINEWVEKYTHGDYSDVPPPDPYMNSLLATPTFAVKPTGEALLDQQVAQYEANKAANAAAISSLSERWAKANETLNPPESIEGAHTRGYWEGRAEADKASLFPEYRVEVIRNDDGSGDNSIEEVLLHDADRCLFHLERLDNDHWWLTLDPTGDWDDEVTFDLLRVKKCIEVTEQ